MHLTTDLASCTTAVVTCNDTGTTTGGWPVVGEVLLAVLLVLALVWLLHERRRRPRRRRVPQRRVHVSAAGDVLRVEHRPPG